MSLSEIVQRGWDAVGAGDFDALVADYVDEMIFIMPGQEDELRGRQAFRSALDSLGDILPPGFEITGLRNLEDGNEVVSIIEWKSDKVAGRYALRHLVSLQPAGQDHRRKMVRRHGTVEGCILDLYESGPDAASESGL